VISRSPDLRRLREEGYEVSIRANHLVIGHVPYVTDDRKVEYGSLVAVLKLRMTRDGEIADTPPDHVIMFAGETPCDHTGRPLAKIVNGSQRQDLGDGLAIDHTFSTRPDPPDANYYDKILRYITILGAEASVLDADATAQTYVVVEERADDSPFLYADTGTAAAGIGAVSEKLKQERVAIVGLGGTGSFILDLVAKTPVREIHLFDGDRMLQHNAYRAPGAASIPDLTGGPMKTDYWAARHAVMRKNVISHPYPIDESNIEELEVMDFVFLAFDRGSIKRAVIERLESREIPFIDVGIGVHQLDGQLGGTLNVTTGTPGHSAIGAGRISFSDRPPDEYAHNIQIADLNALNAALAVIRWKKLRGFYRDLEQEHFSVYTIDGNHLVNDDLP
jgi:hypothetical protein